MGFIRSLTFLTLLTYNLAAQSDYLSYNRQMTAVNLLVFDGKEQQALQKFDSVFHQYDFMFAAHVYLGLQLAGKLQNTKLGYPYMVSAFKAGIPAWLLRQDSLVNRLRIADPEQWQRRMEQYDSLHHTYLDRVPRPLNQTLDSLYQLDQALTNKLNSSVMLRPVYWMRWKKQNKTHARFLVTFIKHHGYPGEKLLGISTLDYTDSTRVRYGTNCFLSYHKTLFMFIHYFSSKRKDLNSVFLPEVLSGNMSPYEYAVLNDFLAEWSKGIYRSNYYNEWHQGPENARAKIDENRRRIGLCSLQQRESFRAYWKEISKKRVEYKTIYLPALP